jgi:hypothetical protein
MDPDQLPDAEDRFGWLAIMQHYGTPTRLLDFTESPYVALYFALRNREAGESEFAEVWAFDAAELGAKSFKISDGADKELRKAKGIPEEHRRLQLGSPLSFSSSLQRAQQEDEQWRNVVQNALNPDGVRRGYFARHGFVAPALPPIQNPRLSRQRGLFVFNGAADVPLERSLEIMMYGVPHNWYRRYRVPEGALRAVEERLFEFNIHDLSLFPDTDGLAGFVRQRIRLHW